MQKQEKRHTENGLMIERMIGIHRKILSGCYPNSQQLAYDFEVSVSTISRDIEYMKTRLNAPIEYDAKHRRYYYSTKFDMPTNLVSSENLIALSYAKVLLSQYDGTPVYDEISDVINFLVDSQGNNASPLLKRIAVPPRSKIILDERKWNLILYAFSHNCIIEFDYKGRWNSETTHRRVHPYQVLIDDGVCSLFGFSEERNAERLFVISRMENITIRKATFELPENFDFANRCAGGRFGAFFKEGNSEKVKVEFYDDAKEWVKERIWADDQQIEEDEYAVTITFSTKQLDEVLHWVLSQGHNAKPLEPASLVEKWKHHITKMAEHAAE